MNFLKNLFSGGGNSGDARGFFVYVRPKRCDQIIEVRIDLRNDLSLTDDGGYWIRKVAQAARCPFPAEVVLHFDKNRRLVSSEVSDGEEVDKAEYEAWLAEKAGTAG